MGLCVSLSGDLVWLCVTLNAITFTTQTIFQSERCFILKIVNRSNWEEKGERECDITKWSSVYLVWIQMA